MIEKERQKENCNLLQFLFVFGNFMASF